MSEDLALNYAVLREEHSEEFPERPLEWEDMYQISEKTGASSNDAMIVNAFVSSKLRLVATADFDVAYACMADKYSDRVCFVPDRIYQRHLEGLRFQEQKSWS